jgi:hypothetical protein
MKFRHLYIDSRYRTSGSDTDFSIALNETVDCEAGTRCWVAGVTFPNTLYTIEEDVDDLWYVAVRIGGVTSGYAFKLSYGNYGGVELAAEMQAKLRTVDNTATASYASKTGRISVVMGAGYELKVVSDEELTNPAFQTAWNAYTPTTPYDLHDPRSFNEIIRAQPTPFASSYLSQLVQLQPFNTLYLHSSLTTYDGIDTIGRSGIVARVPVEKAYGFVNHYAGPFLEQGWFDVGGISFRNLRFSLRNARGRVVPLHGAHLSIHLIFD